MLRLGLTRLAGWDEPGVSVAAEVDLPAAVVDQGVVQPAQQHTVVQTRCAAVTPRLDVVGIAPGHRPPATGVRAPTVTHPQRLADRGGEQALAAADAQWYSGVVDDHR